MNAEAAPRTGHARRLAFVVWLTILSLLIGIVFLGVTALTVAMWFADPTYEETNPVVDLGFFALGAVVIGAGLVAQLRAPERRVAGLQQALIGSLALAWAGLLGDRIEPLWGGMILGAATVTAIVLHPARGDSIRPGAGRCAPLAALALLAAIPAALYAMRMLDLARLAGPSCFAGQCARGDRYAEMAALGVALVIVVLLASARTGGWRASAWSAGVSAVTVGVASVVLPDVPGAVGQAWGTLAVVWGVLVVVAAEWQLRRTATRRSPEGGRQ